MLMMHGVLLACILHVGKLQNYVLEMTVEMVAPSQPHLNLMMSWVIIAQRLIVVESDVVMSENVESYETVKRRPVYIII